MIQLSDRKFNSLKTGALQGFWFLSYNGHFILQTKQWSWQPWSSRMFYLWHHYGGGLVAKSCPTLVTPWTVACQASLSMGFSRQEYWSGLPFPSSGDLPNPGIEPGSSALQPDSLLSEPSGKPAWQLIWGNNEIAHFIKNLLCIMSLMYIITSVPSIFMR